MYKDAVTISPTRTYVASAVDSRMKSFRRTFQLPAEYENNSEMADWYFLNVLDLAACLEHCRAN